MKNKVKIALLGGDLRHHTAACRLSEKGWAVSVWGMDVHGEATSDLFVCQDITEALAGASALVLPLPASLDGSTLNAPLDASESRVSLRSIAEALSMMEQNAVVIGGRLPMAFVQNVAERGYRVVDYFESEEFQIRNAYTTAEAAVSIAMNSMSRELRGARTIVTGYGRIGKHLVSLLRAIGAEVTVAARKDSDLTWAASQGCHVYSLSEKGRAQIGDHMAHGYDVIFNTVPFWLFGRSFLEQVDKKTVLIELASAPGGIDVCAAKELGSNVLWASSLPGKYAPQSAGELIASCVDGILQSEGVGQ